MNRVLLPTGSLALFMGVLGAAVLEMHGRIKCEIKIKKKKHNARHTLVAGARNGREKIVGSTSACVYTYALYDSNVHTISRIYYAIIISKCAQECTHTCV